MHFLNMTSKRLKMSSMFRIVEGHFQLRRWGGCLFGCQPGCHSSPKYLDQSGLFWFLTCHTCAHKYCCLLLKIQCRVDNNFSYHVDWCRNWSKLVLVLLNNNKHIQRYSRWVCSDTRNIGSLHLSVIFKYSRLQNHIYLLNAMKSLLSTYFETALSRLEIIGTI